MIFFPYLNDASYVKMRLNVNFFLIFNSLQPKCYFAIFLIRLIFKGFQKWDSKTIQKCIHLSHAENEYCRRNSITKFARNMAAFVLLREKELFAEKDKEYPSLSDKNVKGYREKDFNLFNS